MPEDNPESIIKLADIVECEILTVFAENAKEGGIDFSNWSANYAITQNVTSTDGVSVDPLTWLSPARVDKLIYSAGGNLEREGYRNGKVEYSVYVLEPKSKACSRARTYKDVAVSPSDFKLRDWVRQVSHPTEKQLNNFSYSVRVQMVMSAGFGTDFADGKWTAADGLSHERKTIKTIDFSFAQLPKPPKPTKVIVVAPIPTAGTDGKGATPNFVKPQPRGGVAKPQISGPRIVPDAAVERNRRVMELQQLDRISPDLSDQ
ncbi:hypothetical protein [Rhizobium leguminosarum]|uniref:hypothetical protein n=1 Tax=Rhizobium leguminosarum TaxID=384 RepID=UPI003F97B2CE